jgi:uncharacterized coiled-coil protein SlyX
VTNPPGQLPPLFEFISDVAHQSTLNQVLAQQATILDGMAHLSKQLSTLNRKVTKMGTEDATVAAEVADIDAQATVTNTALTSVQALLVALQAEGNLSPATLAALTQAQTDMDALSAQAQADVAADTPPAV